MSESEDKHQQRMAKKKAIVDQKIAQAQEERGVVILLKGNGKGKSSSALGTMARSLGYGKKCAVIQFIKGRNETGEQKFFKDWVPKNIKVDSYENSACNWFIPQPNLDRILRANGIETKGARRLDFLLCY